MFKVRVVSFSAGRGFLMISFADSLLSSMFLAWWGECAGKQKPWELEKKNQSCPSNLLNELVLCVEVRSPALWGVFTLGGWPQNHVHYWSPTLYLAKTLWGEWHLQTQTNWPGSRLWEKDQDILPKVNSLPYLITQFQVLSSVSRFWIQTFVYK